MNANELIEFSEDTASEARANGFSDVRFMQTATMLRQQQKRIKQLEKTQEYLYKTHDAHKAQIEALKRPNNVVGVPADKLAEMQAEIERLTMLCDCMTTESNRKGNEIEALKVKAHEWYLIAMGKAQEK